MKKLILGIVIALLWITTVAISFYAGTLIQWASDEELELSKNYAEIVVNEFEVVDYSVFLDVPAEYGVLNQIEEPIRKTIAFYMQANKLKLAPGTHTFHRVNGSLDAYLHSEFQFEPME